MIDNRQCSNDFLATCLCVRVVTSNISTKANEINKFSYDRHVERPFHENQSGGLLEIQIILTSLLMDR